jgi:hypothetical protein
MAFLFENVVYYAPIDVKKDWCFFVLNVAVFIGAAVVMLTQKNTC